MSYKSTRRQWVKLWVNEWLDGTTRFELTAPQRLLWIDLLALAGRSRFPGFIYAGSGEGDKRVGYPMAYLAGVLQMDEVTLNHALRLLQVHCHITLDEVAPDSWIIGIVNWEKYQSEYLRQKVYRRINPEKIAAKQMVNKAVKDGSLIKSGTCEKCGASGRIEGHHPDYSKPMEVVWLCPPCHRKVTTDCTSRLPVEVEEEVEVEGENTSAATPPDGGKVMFSSRYFKVSDSWLSDWEKAYPNLGVLEELDRMVVWLDANPRKSKKKNWYRFVTGWLGREYARVTSDAVKARAVTAEARVGQNRNLRPTAEQEQEAARIKAKYPDLA